MKRLLITGGLGYIGARLAAYLQNTGQYHITVTSRQPPNILPEALNGVAVKSLDLSDSAAIDPSLCEGIDTIIHLAALNEIDSARNSELAETVNGNGTQRLLDTACQQDVSRFIYFSTIHVYGAALSGFIDESTKPQPTHPYATSHLSAENHVLTYHQQQKIEGCIFRLSNAFGPPEIASVNRWMLLLNQLARDIVNTGRCQLQSSGQQFRDFITLMDVCAATRHCVDVVFDQVGDPLLHLASGQSTRVVAMAEMLVKRAEYLLKKPITFEVPAKKAIEQQTPAYQFNIARLADLGFVPQNQYRSSLDRLLLFCDHAFSSIRSVRPR